MWRPREVASQLVCESGLGHRWSWLQEPPKEPEGLDSGRTHRAGMKLGCCDSQVLQWPASCRHQLVEGWVQVALGVTARDDRLGTRLPQAALVQLAFWPSRLASWTFFFPPFLHLLVDKGPMIVYYAVPRSFSQFRQFNSFG